jgi:hypothetical protein
MEDERDGKGLEGGGRVGGWTERRVEGFVVALLLRLKG